MLTAFRLVPRPHGRLAGIEPGRQLPGLDLALRIREAYPRLHIPIDDLAPIPRARDLACFVSVLLLERNAPAQQ